MAENIWLKPSRALPAFGAASPAPASLPAAPRRFRQQRRQQQPQQQSRSRAAVAKPAAVTVVEENKAVEEVEKL